MPSTYWLQRTINPESRKLLLFCWIIIIFPHHSVDFYMRNATGISKCKMQYKWFLELVFGSKSLFVFSYSKVEQILTCGPSDKGMYLFKPKCNVATVINEIQREFGESACYVLSLLGKTYLKTERYQLAEQCLLAALKLNPLLWVSFKKLCEAGMLLWQPQGLSSPESDKVLSHLGYDPDPQKIFASHSALNMSIWKLCSNNDRLGKMEYSNACVE